MSGSALFRRGLAEVRRQPALALAEIVWRWCYGVAAWGVIALAVYEFLAARPVTDVDLGLLASREPTLVSLALGEILQDSGRHLLRILAALIPALALMWIVAASLGRVATLRWLLGDKAKPRLRAQFGVSFLRAALALAGVLGYFGSIVLAGLLIPNAQEYLGAIILVAMMFAAIVGALWGMVNWFLSLAPIFVARDECDTMAGIAASLGLYRRRASAYVSLATAFGVVRGVALLVVLGISLTVLPVLAGGSRALGWASGITLALAYFALADTLYVARLAAYVELAEEKETQATAAAAPEPAPEPPAPAMIDTTAQGSEAGGSSAMNTTALRQEREERRLRSGGGRFTLARDFETVERGSPIDRRSRLRLAVHTAHRTAYSRAKRLLRCTSL